MVVESNDTVAVQRWLGAWSDFIDWEAYIVVNDEECAPIIEALLKQ